VQPQKLAQQRVVRGLVISADTGRAIVGATVLTDRGEVATTDLDGYFEIIVGERDRELTITAPGFATRSVRVPVAADTLARIELQAARGDEVIEVSGSAPEQTKPLSYQLSADEIRFMPGATNDILRAAQALPGVSRIPFSFGGLVLRGTSPRDTAVYLDGIEVPIAFHAGGLTSFYPGSMLESLSITADGFDASHGRAQGGLVTLTTREPRTDIWRVGGTIGLLDSSVFAEGPWQGGGVLVGVRRGYLDTILGPFVEDDVPLPSYWDVQLRTSFGDPRKRGRITPMVFASIDRIVNDEVSLTSLFVRAAVPFTRAWGATTLRVVPWIGWTHLSFTEDRGGPGPEDSLSRPSIPGGVRSELVRDYPWGHVRGGLDIDSGYLAQTEIDVDDIEREVGTTLAWVDIAGWAETRIKLDGERFALKPGLRVDYYGIARELVVDPRLNIHQRLGEGIVLRQAIGRYHQPPIPADVDRSNGNPELKSSYMDHASLGIDAELGADAAGERAWLASVTTFAGYGNDIGVRVAQRTNEELSPNLGGLGPTFQLLLEKQLGFSSYRENLGRARLAGIEVLLKRTSPRWFFMLAYTLAWSQRTDDPRQDLGWRAFELDQRHNVNVAASWKLGKWRLGARVQLVSGNPYSPLRVTILDDGEPLIEQDPFGARLPWFFHLDVRADRSWERAWGDINLFFDIQNVTNRRNVEGRDVAYDAARPYGYDDDVPGLPIVPFIGVEFIPH
jgi:hypothetical protein